MNIRYKIVTIGLIGLLSQALDAKDVKQVKIFTFEPSAEVADSIPGIKSCKETVKALRKQQKQTIINPFYVHIKELSQAWLLSPGIQKDQDNEVVTLFSRGIRDIKETFLSKKNNYGKSFISIYKYVQIGVIQTKAIVFDYIDTWLNFDFGGKTRTAVLESILDDLQQKNKSVVLFGDCVGAKTILQCIDHSKFKHVKAIILEAPLFDVSNVAKNIAKNKVKWLPFGKSILHSILTKLMPSYQKSTDIDYHKIDLPKEIPILMTHLYNDTLVDNDTMSKMVATLVDSGHTVYYLIIDDPSVNHSRIGTTKPFITTINAFYKKLGLPHNGQLASQGEQYLERALHNAIEKKIQHIEKA